MTRPISNQVIVITGASSGIGLATAKMAAREGARVVLAARNERSLNESVKEIEREGGRARAVVCDVTDFDQVKNLVHEAVEAFGVIDTWVNNAAVSVYGTFKETPLEDFRQVLETNLMGQVHGARAVLPHLEMSEGTLIFVGSVLSDRSVPLQSAYCASKHALKGFVDSLRVELDREESPVQVTLVKPASINTPLFRKARTYLGREPMPLPPIYEPELVAKAILQAAISEKRDVYVGTAGMGLSVGERISPRLVDAQLKRTAFDGQKTARPKSAEEPDNLYEPVEDDGGLYGGFIAKKRSLLEVLRTRSIALVAALFYGEEDLFDPSP